MIIPTTYGEIFKRFKMMMIKHPRAETAFKEFDDLREGKRDSPKFIEQVGALLLAPSHSGKSRTVEMYILKRVVPECIERGLIPAGASDAVAFDMQRLVLHITLSSPATVGSLMSDLLEKLGDPMPEKGTIGQRRRRVFDLMREHGTELLIIDEIQHLSLQIGDGPTKTKEDATSVQNNLKRFLQAGFPCVFIGRPEARKKIFHEEQVVLRVEEEIDFSPLDFDIESDRKIIREFLARLAITMHRQKIFDHVVDLLSGDLPECIMQGVGGRLGLSTVLVRRATKIAFYESADTLTREHLSLATEQYVRRKVFDLTHNPFNTVELTA